MTIIGRITHLSSTLIETGLWHIERYLIGKYGVSTAERDMYPLTWYINTGRAPLEFVWAVLNSKPFMIRRILHAGGSTDEVIGRVKAYVGWEGVE